MRALIVSALMAVMAGQGAATIAPEDASKHVGESVMVQGTVSHVKIDAKNGSIYVDFGPQYPNQVFTAFIVPANAKSFPNVQNLTGKAVIVNGTIILYKGKPEIKVTKALQLQIVT